MAEPFDTIGASFADVIDRLAKGEITEAQAAAALSPLLAATNDGEFAARVEEIVGVIGRVTGLLFVEVPVGQDRPSNLIGAPDAYAWDRQRKTFWGPKDKVTGWPDGDVMTEGKSALQVLIDGGVLPPGSTAEDFGTWLANSQSAVIQPIADAAAVSATAAAASETGAETAQGAAEQAVAAAEAAATATGEDRAATGADRAAVATDRTAVEVAATAVGDAAIAAGSAATAAGLAADDAIAARGDAQAAKGAAEEAAEASGQDALATAADRQAVAEDKTVVAADRTAAETAAGTATTKAGEASGHADDAEAARAVAVAAKVAAELARDQAQEIVGGDFMTEAEANTLYRKLIDLLNISDVDGLADALASKATPADVTAAIDALVGAAPGTLDTIYELAAWAQESGDALAALTTLVAGKASQADFDTLATTVGGKASQAALDALTATVGAISVPTFASVAEVWAGAVTNKIIPPKVLNDAMIPQALAILAGVVSPDCNAGINFDIASINANITFANLANKAGKTGRSGSITGKNDATAGRTVSLGTDWKKIGTTAFPTAANAMWKIVYNIDANGVNYSVSVLSA